MLVDLGPAVYESDFERPFLAAAADFYAKEAQAFVATCDCPQYLRMVGGGGAAQRLACFASSGLLYAGLRGT